MSMSHSSNANGNGAKHDPPPPPPEPPRYPNPPDPYNPDAATLREQWKYATRQYSKWYSHAWGTAILAGISLFALGWYIKGENPLSSATTKEEDKSQGAS